MPAIEIYRIPAHPVTAYQAADFPHLLASKSWRRQCAPRSENPITASPLPTYGSPARQACMRMVKSIIMTNKNPSAMMYFSCPRHTDEYQSCTAHLTDP